MPRDELVAVDALGQQRLGAGEGQQAAGQRGGAGRAFHRVVEVHHHLAPRAVEAAQRKVDAADDDGQHVVEVVGDAAGQLADRLHLLDLAKLGFGRFALGGFGLERLVRLPQLLRALAHRLLELLGAFGLALGLAPGGGVLAQRLDRDDAEEDRAEPDDDPEPAEIIGQLVGLSGEDLALLDAVAQRLALGADDLLELVVERVAGAGARGGVEIADSGIALLGQRGAGGERELAAALVVQLLELGDARAAAPGCCAQRLAAGRSGSRRAASRWRRCCRWS